MATISLQRLRVLLRRAKITTSTHAFDELLAALAARDVSMQRADILEAEINAEVGLPRVVIEQEDDLLFVASQATIDQLVSDGKLDAADADWMKRRLARRQQQWWEQASLLGLRGLRRRERRLARYARALVRSFINKPGHDLLEIRLKLALVIASETPCPAHLSRLLDDLIRLT